MNTSHSAHSLIPQLSWILNLSFTLLGEMWMVFSSFFGGKPDNPPGEDRWGARLANKLVVVGGADVRRRHD